MDDKQKLSGALDRYISSSPSRKIAPATMGASEEVYGSAISHVHITKTTTALNTPPVDTPPRSATPPLVGEKRKSETKAAEENMPRSSRATPSADAIDPNRLNKALLKEFDDAGRHRDITPGGSPSRKRQRVYGDR